MIIRKPSDIASSEITPESVYLNRRDFIARAGTIGAGVVAGAGLLSACTNDGSREYTSDGEVAPAQEEKPNTYEEITSYNNYYEFGGDKDDPSNPALSGSFKPKPWTVRVEGMVKKPADYAFDDLIRTPEIVDRTYRLRCVEAWSMVIPWQGVPLATLINRFEPTASAKFVEFTTVFRPSEMPGQRTGLLDWPYVEGLRLDEAKHPLTLFATGIYGKPLLAQNGAPLRLVVPWKYGFKGIKSIVKIRFTDRQPVNTWQATNPGEYGFYANVNPTVDHPRWTQASERRIGQFRRLQTKMFNGYADQVESMYAGMDLRKNY
jgi:sulfoxide reductase catalytic subunit YedY